MNNFRKFEKIAIRRIALSTFRTTGPSRFAGKKRNLASVVAYDGECKVWTNLVTRACDDPSPKDRRLWLPD